MRLEYNLQQPNFSVINVDILNVSRPKNYRHSYRNGRTKHGFIYTVQGKMRDEFLSSQIGPLDAGTGELVFIPKGSRYEGIYLDENTEIKIVQFDLSSGALPEYLSEPKNIPLSNAGDLIDAFFQPNTDHPFYYFSCLYQLLWQIDECFSGIPRKYERLRPALTEIRTRFDKNEKIEYYADLCDMSEVHFRRLFREYAGMSPIDYRNDVRLTEAKKLLQSREYNVSEAGELVGFSNLSFFIRLYSRKFGHTPKKE